jgi:predicted membrane protein
MKIITMLVVIWLCLAPVQAQQIIEKHMDFSEKESVALYIQIADSINIQTWNKNEVYVKASVYINENKDNEAYITSFDESGSSLSVNAKFRDKYFNGKNNCCNKTDIYWQVFIPEKTRFSVETINANVTITGQTKEMKVKSISGYIDLAVPVNKQADLDFSTISGTMYSNHELALNQNHGGMPSKIMEKLNDGGVPIKLETISGDIFFRKSN